MLVFHDTLTGERREFAPADPKRVTLYACGPTVWSSPHIGNARSAITFDVLFRVLRHLYGENAVIYARNLTDVDDKIVEAANTKGIDIGQHTDEIIRLYETDMASLNVLEPTFKPRVTHSILEIIQMIEVLLDRDAAYVSEGHVLFRVSAHANHGKLSGQNQDDLLEAVRIDAVSYKEHAADFVLWKPVKPGEPAWDSPWGRGRCGWHIECSTLIAKHLGTTIDIHGGGNDLIFPHHECEIAQSECAHGEPLARYWVHNGMVTVDGRKMSKSAGNFVTVSDALAHQPGEALRYLLLGAHYRQPVDFTWEKLQEAKTALDRLYRALEHVWDADEDQIGVVVPPALLNDLNTPETLAGLHKLASHILSGQYPFYERPDLRNALVGIGSLLGLLTKTPAQWFRGEINPLAEQLIREREVQRAARNWAAADAIRNTLLHMGVTIEDTPDGPIWRTA